MGRDVKFKILPFATGIRILWLICRNMFFILLLFITAFIARGYPFSRDKNFPNSVKIESSYRHNRTCSLTQAMTEKV